MHPVERGISMSSLAQILIVAASLLASSLPAIAAESPLLAGQTPELKSLCTNEHLQALAPPEINVGDITDLNPSISSVVKTSKGVAYVAAGAMGDDSPEYCLVTGTVVTNPATGKTANFGAALPAAAAWSKRMLMQGCGGNCGDVFDNGPPAPTLIKRGYAVWTTDDGHVDPAYARLGHPLMVESSWTLKHVGEANADAIVDYGYRAVHTVAQLGKSYTSRIYGAHAIDRAYFLGCSDGGREAMQEASLFPEDFDGIVAGAPFLDPIATILGGVATQLAQFKSPGSAVPAASFDIISKAIVAKCDASDGVTDGLVQNPGACTFNPQLDLPKCSASKRVDCLTQDQLDVVTAVFSSVRDPSGQVIAPGYTTVSTGLHDGGWGLASFVAFPIAPKNMTGPEPFGPEQENYFFAWPLTDGWLRNFTNLGDPHYNSVSGLGIQWIRGGKTDAGAYNAVVPNATVDRVRRSVQMLSANNPYQLASFIQQNRHLIIWHGYADGLLHPYVTIRFYEELAGLHGGYDKLRKNVELFMAPDVAHCGWGGEGPNAIQTLYHKVEGELPPPVMDPEHDLLMALEHWVENQSAPQHVIASRYQDDDPRKPVVRSMPLCPFPAQARYRGTGNVKDAAAWTCPIDDQRLLTVGAFGSRAGL